MVIVFAKPALFALNPLYDLASNIVIVLVFSIFQMSINKIFVSGLQGIEKVDLKPDATFKDHFKSKLFFLPTIQNFRAAWYLGILVITLIYFKSQGVSELELVFIWAVVDCISRVPQTVYLYTIIRREFSPKIKKKYVIKYFLVATTVFTAVFISVDYSRDILLTQSSANATGHVCAAFRQENAFLLCNAPTRFWLWRCSSSI